MMRVERGKNEVERCSRRQLRRRMVQKRNREEEEDDEELDLNTAVQHAGKHMEDCIVASCTALLLGCLCQESPPQPLSFPFSLRAPVQSVVITNAVAPAELTPKQVTIKPVVTAFLLVSAVKTAGSRVINVKLTNNTMVKDTVISVASIQSTSSAIIKAANATQQQTVVVLGSSLANAKLVPKTAPCQLNLLPQGSQATAELCQVCTTPQQQIKQAIINAVASQPPKKVSWILAVSSLQSSVVEAFNKLLCSNGAAAQQEGGSMNGHRMNLWLQVPEHYLRSRDLISRAGERAAQLAESKTGELNRDAPTTQHDESGERQKEVGRCEGRQLRRRMVQRKQEEEEDDEELDLNKAVQHAGKHMEIALWPHHSTILGVSAKRVHLKAPVQSVVITNAVAPAELTPKQVTIKPVVTAFPGVSCEDGWLASH
ncbi:Zinc finger protein 532 [Camelus dromedarius]|uniref:Zinc finger protein 532 n=1 Tax=Camelus dromedarius TaxID=9838 RepID=A0A5N4DJT0_CAMDR|nr:Zinc finger protein 532 [Camelus dromedarius]KAB1271327.1 Zinc finger protein 532 [Camelus dromedarius]